MSSVPVLQSNYSAAMITDYIESLRAQNRFAPTSLAQYASDLARAHLWFSARGIDLYNAKTQDIIDYLGNELRESKPSTKGRCLTSLKGFFGEMIKRRFIRKNPIIGVPRQRPRWQPDPARLLSRDELDALLKATDPSDPLGSRNSLILKCLAMTSIKTDRLTGLTINQINLSTGAGPTWRSRTHAVTQTMFPVELAKEMEIYVRESRPRIVRERDCDYFFPSKDGERLTRAMVFYVLKRYRILAGISRSVTASDLRRSYLKYYGDVGST